MRPYGKFTRVVLAATVGSMLWAGCATNHTAVPRKYVADHEIALDPQVDLTNMHADTHPEWRLGSDMAFPNPPYPHTRADQISIALDQPIL